MELAELQQAMLEGEDVALCPMLSTGVSKWIGLLLPKTLVRVKRFS